MNKKLLLGILLLAVSAKAALISRTYTYTSGNTITASENNTNENTLYTEINGNLNSANIATGGIATTNLADTSVTTAKLAASITVTTLTVTNPFEQKGITDGTSASAGYIGEVLSSSTLTGKAVPATTVYGDVCGVLLTPGDWLITARMQYNNALSTSLSFVLTGISSVTGNSSSGLTTPTTSFGQQMVPAAQNVTWPYEIANLHVSLSANTTYYLKIYSEYSNGSPTATGTIYGVRIR